MSHPGDRALERLAVGGDQPCSVSHGSGDRDLLAEHRAHRELVRVDVAGDAPSRRRADERADGLIRAERREHGLRIGVEVEQRPGARHGRVEVGRVDPSDVKFT